MATSAEDSKYIDSGDSGTDEVSSDTEEDTKDNESVDGVADDIPKPDDDNQNSTENCAGEENNMQCPLQGNSEQSKDEESANGENSAVDNDGKCYSERNPDHCYERGVVHTDNTDGMPVLLEVARNDKEDVVMKTVSQETSQLQEFEGVLEKPNETADLVVEAQNLPEGAALRLIWRPKALEINKEMATGSEFPDYLSFKNTVARYCKAHGVTYVTAFSTTVASRNKHCVEPFAESLRFANLRLRCKYGGPQRASTARIRKSTMTCKTQCPSSMTLVARANPARLRVISFVEEHNHELEPPGQQGSKGKTPWERPNTKQSRRSAPPKVHVGRSTSRTSAKQVVRALSNNLSPSRRSPLNSSTPRSPMVTFRPLSSLTAPTKLSTPLRSMAPPTALNTHVVRRKNVRVVPMRKLQQASCENPCGMTTPGPAFNKEITIDITDDVEIEAEDVKTTQTVTQVNEAWKCVYNILEEDYRKLRAEVQRLRRENQRLRTTSCTMCGSRQT